MSFSFSELDFMKPELGAEYTGSGTHFAVFSANAEKVETLPLFTGWQDRDGAHGAAEARGRHLVRLYRRHRPRHGLRLSRPRALRSGERPSLQPQQAAARPLRQADRRRPHLGRCAVRLHDRRRGRRPVLRRARQRALHGQGRRPGSRFRLGRRQGDPPALDGNGDLRGPWSAA